MAVTLAWGKGAAISHAAAAALFGLDGFERGPAELTVPRGRRRHGIPAIVHEQTLGPRDIARVEGIPVVRPALLLLQVAAVAPPAAVESAFDDALRRRLVTLPQMRRVLAARHSGRVGVVLIRKLILDRLGLAISDSDMETVFLRLVRSSDLPMPAFQHQVEGFRIDAAYPDAMIAVELDGYRWHSDPRQWAKDRERDCRLLLLGWRVVRFTHAALESRPAEVVETIRRLLAGPDAGQTRARRGPDAGQTRARRGPDAGQTRGRRVSRREAAGKKEGGGR